jgi:hypothetical protein
MFLETVDSPAQHSKEISRRTGPQADSSAVFKPRYTKRTDMKEELARLPRGPLKDYARLGPEYTGYVNTSGTRSIKGKLTSTPSESYADYGSLSRDIGPEEKASITAYLHNPPVLHIRR